MRAKSHEININNSENMKFGRWKTLTNLSNQASSSLSLARQSRLTADGLGGTAMMPSGELAGRCREPGLGYKVK